MNDETLNLSIRKFLKFVGISSQRAIEQAVAKAAANGAITGKETLPAKMTLSVDGIDVNVEFDGEIRDRLFSANRSAALNIRSSKSYTTMSLGP